MIRRPPRSTQSRSSAASDVYKRQVSKGSTTRAPPKLARRCAGAPPRPPTSTSSKRRAALRARGEEEKEEEEEDEDEDALRACREWSTGAPVGLAFLCAVARGR